MAGARFACALVFPLLVMLAGCGRGNGLPGDVPTLPAADGSMILLAAYACG
jgi:hypothetical protein